MRRTTATRLRRLPRLTYEKLARLRKRVQKQLEREREFNLALLERATRAKQIRSGQF